MNTINTENMGTPHQLKAVFASAKTLSLFLKEKGSARGKENFFSREKKFFFSPRLHTAYSERGAGTGQEAGTLRLM